jgi:two-component system, NarL family, response regulator DevR
MDVRLQDGSGIEATRDIRAARPHTAVLMLTSFADDEVVFASIMPRAEERILGLVAEGRTNRQIAGVLGLAEKTVKNYVSSILAKLEVTRRAEAAACLARHTNLPGS